MKLTHSQEKAVNTENKEVLVSAAAGSGKTSVLAKRVVRLVREGAEVSRMLVVTFTNLAAGEMRLRIRRELMASAELEQDKKLMRQAEAVDGADICTLHGFCIKLIRENFSLLGLPSDIKTAGDEEQQILKQEALEQTFESLYEAEEESFLALRGRYGGRTEDSLKELLLWIYDFSRSRPEGMEWVARLSEFDEEAFLIAGKKYALGKLLLMEDAARACLDLDVSEKQQNNDRLDGELTEKLLESFRAGRLAEYDRLVLEAKIPSITRGIQDEEKKARLGELKSAMRAALKDLRELPLFGVVARLKKEAPYMEETAQAVYRVLSDFETNYAREKLDRHLMDYDDMMFFARRLLGIEEVRKSYSDKYDYMFVDEYQDINPVQEALIMELSPKKGRFMVGDMKQSIYRFRLADPLIFKSKAESFAAGADKEIIHMNRNFRSGGGVVSFINALMAALMSEQLGELSYDEKEMLEQGGAGNGDAKILLTEYEGEQQENNPVKEAHTVAREILTLLKSGYRKSDICILLRKVQSDGEIFADVLSRYGIDARLPSGRGVVNAHIEVFFNLIKISDGYNSDIALLSVMKNVCGFDENELAKIRAASSLRRFSDALFAYSAGEGELSQKCRAFMEKIEHYKACSRFLPIEKFLVFLNSDTRFGDLVAAQAYGVEKAEEFRAFFDNLLALAAGKSSLFELVSHLEAVKKQTGNYGAKLGAGGGDYVRIMTIHSSKGLEFPVVILARTDSRFSSRDFRRPLYLHGSLGLAGDMVNEQTHTFLHSLAKKLMRFELEMELKSEELRILYVALTRAKEKLILSGVAKEKQRIAPGRTGWFWLADMSSPLDWILAAAAEAGIRCETASNFAGGGEESYTRKDFSELFAEAQRTPAFRFLRYEEEPLPAKLGVSSLLPDLGEALPFAGGARKDGGAELGTLIHYFLQSLPLSVQTEEGVAAQAEEMEAKAMLTQGEKNRLLVFLPEITAFLTSEVAERARRATKVMRELPFSLAFYAREAGYQSEEKILVQGIIDLVFEEKDGLVLVDYKSNYTDEAGMAAVAEKYRTQLLMYTRALQEITHKPVKESMIWFIRPKQEFRVF